ncbi:MAG: hypothetical protein EHM28_03410, partial [Spirochaetaceae bacterium]
MKTRKIAVIALGFVLLAAVAFGADTKKYASEEDRFTIQYPANWIFNDDDDDGYGFYSSGAFQDGEGDGAVVYVRIEELEAEFATDLEKLFLAAMEELNDDIE